MTRHVRLNAMGEMAVHAFLISIHWRDRRWLAFEHAEAEFNEGLRPPVLRLGNHALPLCGDWFASLPPKGQKDHP